MQYSLISHLSDCHLYQRSISAALVDKTAYAAFRIDCIFQISQERFWIRSVKRILLRSASVLYTNIFPIYWNGRNSSAIIDVELSHDKKWIIQVLCLVELSIEKLKRFVNLFVLPFKVAHGTRGTRTLTSKILNKF